MKFLYLIFASLAVAAPTVTPANGDHRALAARENTIEARQSSSVIFESISASGAGCPSGSFTTVISPSKDVGTIAFREYAAFLPSPANRACTVTVTLTYPGGCTKGNFQGTTHGFAQVNSGVSGTYTTSYSSSTGNSANPPASTFSGSSWVNGNPFSKTDVAPAQVVNRSPNSAQVTYTATTELNLGSGSGGDLTVDDITFTITNQSNDPDWENCS